MFYMLLLFFPPGIAQQISGFVFEEGSDGHRIALPGVNVLVEGTLTGSVTDTEGRFTLSIPAGKHPMLVVSFIGYQPDTVFVDPGVHHYEIRMMPTSEMLEEVVISERQKSSFVSMIDPLHVHVITSNELLKAACCNLSESFETNASVDVSYSDAVSGSKRIDLLGLHGKYVQMITENLPNLRGLGATYGLGYIPGPWMESIQISKGTATVLNGYESITGQINIEFKKPDKAEMLYLNGYVNHIGKTEGNAYSAVRLNDRWSTMLYGHVEDLGHRVDHNGDSFIDEPLIRQYNVFNRWKYMQGNVMAQFGLKFLDEHRTGGQMTFRSPETPGASSPYGIDIRTRRFEVFGKTGYIVPSHPATSLGFVNIFSIHDQESLFGLNDYNGTENNYNGSLIMQSQLGSPRHAYSAGVSYLYDSYRESLNDSIFSRDERVPGAFLQYTYSDSTHLTWIAGIRADHHNIHGWLMTPRIHVRWGIDSRTVLRASAGMGYHTPNIIAENSYLLASSRRLYVDLELPQEVAWNYGLNLTRHIDLSGRELTFSGEYYRTDFRSQVIIDRDRNSSEIYVYKLDGPSFSNSYQVEAGYELLRGMDIVAAFRVSDVRMTINGELDREPLVKRYKGLMSLSYQTLSRKWQFDLTTQLNGDSRLPDTRSLPEQYRRPANSPAFVIFNAQVSRFFRNWSIYLGAENLLDFVQQNPLIAPEDPYGPWFDASMVWGPLMGRKIYFGFRYAINNPK
ncbi:MAG: TonB-dependent receptor [Bacteroidales bacterium]|nr:TonB-dependent receptor [Bacteroidales bacterium]